MENIALIESFSEFKDDKFIDRVTLMAILEDVFRNALKKKFGSDDNFDIIINPDKGDLEIWRNRVVVEDGEVEDPNEVLKIAALEALISAPPERALPLVIKVLDADNTNDVKERALFVLSQIDMPEAQTRLLDVARSGDPELSEEAVRMIGIGGNEEALAGLAELYSSGDEDLREAVLEAYMIAGNVDAVYAIANNASDEEEFEAAVEMLGVMGANDKLRELSKSSSYTESLVMALAISGDYETLRQMAFDSSDPKNQLDAIEALGIIGGDDVNGTLVEIYRGAESDDIREAAREGSQRA